MIRVPELVKICICNYFFLGCAFANESNCSEQVRRLREIGSADASSLNDSNLKSIRAELASENGEARKLARKVFGNFYIAGIDPAIFSGYSSDFISALAKRFQTLELVNVVNDSESQDLLWLIRKAGIGSDIERSQALLGDRLDFQNPPLSFERAHHPVILFSTEGIMLYNADVRFKKK